jgi:hypothetical protein
MRFTRVLLTYCALTCGVCLQSLAQSGYPQGCYDQPDYSACTPPNGGSCSSHYPLSSFALEGWVFSWQPASCCGSQIWVPYTYESTCFTASLRDPESIRQLSELSKHTRLLIASCDGYLRPVPRLAPSDTTNTQAPPYTLPSHRSLLTSTPSGN